MDGELNLHMYIDEDTAVMRSSANKNWDYQLLDFSWTNSVMCKLFQRGQI